MSLTFDRISHAFGTAQILSDIELHVAPGEIVCILGPSGSGKSTLLRIAAGLEPVQSGSVQIGSDCTATAAFSPPPEARSVGLVFQDHALFPHLNIADNVGFGLSHLANTQRHDRVTDYLRSVGLAEFATRFPHTLSGGQQQRVALIRALVTDPEVMLLDEPFASVDTPLRRKLREDARATLKRTQTATLLVTHDPEEAMAMADRIAIMEDGQLVQVAAPEALWRKPANAFVAQTLAGFETIKGVVTADGVETAFGVVPARRLPSDFAPTSTAVQLGIRSRSMSLRARPATATLDDIRFQGLHHHLLLSGGTETITIIATAKPAASIGDAVGIDFTFADVLVYT